MASPANEYRPDYVSPPGDTLEELLEERGMSQAELAERTGRPKKTINEIIQGKTAITPETALQLERVLGTPASWLRQGERLAQAIPYAPYDATRFRQALQEARALSREEPVEGFKRLPVLCAPAGVAVVILPELSQTRLCGAARWLTPSKALIQLSLRYKRDDQFWFTFFHEAGHILLHGKREAHLDEEDRERTEKEEQANRFAADLLIPPEALRAFLRQRRGPLSQVQVEQFAADLGIAPGILVGRLQRDKVLPPSHLNGLKRPLPTQVPS